MVRATGIVNSNHPVVSFLISQPRAPTLCLKREIVEREIVERETARTAMLATRPLSAPSSLTRHACLERIVACILLAICFGSIPVRGDDPPLFLSKTDSDRANLLRSRPWIKTIEQEIPPLANDAQGRMPMIMWHGVGFQPLAPEEIEILRERGLCQHLQLNEAMIPAAKTLADAGMPVILMEGRTDSWPYSLSDELKGSDGEWAHQFDLTYVLPWFGQDDSTQWHGACPEHVDGWQVMEQHTRATMQAFKDAGVRVDAVLVDFEGDPYPWPHLFQQLRHCRRCRQELPAEVVQSESAWRDYAWKKYVALYDTHFAKPIREVFPDALVTNWHVVYSSRQVPVRYFVNDIALPELRPHSFSATNPIAYASDAAWRNLWNPETELTQTSVDDFYANEIIHQVDADRRNRERMGAADVPSIPWVARACRIPGVESAGVPIMSRDRYRQSLVDLWKHGVHGMQVFNAMHEGYEELALVELQDAVAAYDKMLAEPQGGRESIRSPVRITAP